jgi:hypothetical protein
VGTKVRPTGDRVELTSVCGVGWVVRWQADPHRRRAGAEERKRRGSAWLSACWDTVTIATTGGVVDRVLDAHRQRRLCVQRHVVGKRRCWGGWVWGVGEVSGWSLWLVVGRLGR